MSKQHFEPDAFPLLGKEARGDQLVEWSKKHKRGQRWVKDFAFGLRLGFVADGLAPKVYLYWNQTVFQRFISNLTFNPDVLFFTEYGICVNHREKYTRVTLPGLGASKVTLWDSNLEFCQQQAESPVYWMLGMLRFSEEGPVFHDQAETQQELEEATAVASIRVTQKEKKATKPAAVVLPKKELSNSARAYLFQDVITNIILQAQQSNKAG